MAIILSIDTSTNISSIAIHDAGRLIASQSIHKNKSHSEYLVPSIKYLFEMGNISFHSIDAVAISKGPGSYTGLRIGTSTAKGLCYGLDTRLIAVNTLEAMCLGIRKYMDNNYYLCPMLDARRMEVYCLVMLPDRTIQEHTQAKIIDENSFASFLNIHKMVFFGGGASKCKPSLASHPNAIFIDEVHPSAEHIGALAWEKYQNNQFEDLAYFEPFYLKDFIAKKPSADKLV
jgi:tRNA threonylcarbamoyladenosine biosynthesis protein TsaB